jgi:hypothetical protein
MTVTYITNRSPGRKAGRVPRPVGCQRTLCYFAAARVRLAVFSVSSRRARGTFFETIGASASGDFGERSCGGWPKAADYAHRAALCADPLGSNPPYELLRQMNFKGCVGLGGEYNHKSVKHSARQYVVGAVHTNTIEGFWSILKRGIVGSYHKVSRKYLPLYVAECQL